MSTPTVTEGVVEVQAHAANSCSPCADSSRECLPLADGLNHDALDCNAVHITIGDESTHINEACVDVEIGAVSCAESKVLPQPLPSVVDVSFVSAMQQLNSFDDDKYSALLSEHRSARSHPSFQVYQLQQHQAAKQRYNTNAQAQRCTPLLHDSDDSDLSDDDREREHSANSRMSTAHSTTSSSASSSSSTSSSSHKEQRCFGSSVAGALTTSSSSPCISSANLNASSASAPAQPVSASASLSNSALRRATDEHDSALPSSAPAPAPAPVLPLQDQELILVDPPTQQAPASANDWQSRFAQDIALSEHLGSEWAQLDASTPADIQQRAENSAALAATIPPTLLETRAALGRNAHFQAQRRQAEFDRIEREGDRMVGRAPAKNKKSRFELIPPPPPVMVTCGICQEEVPESSTVVFGRQWYVRDGVRLQVNGDVYQGFGSDGSLSFSSSSAAAEKKRVQCSHAFCRDCLRSYLEHQINDGLVLKLRCPGRDDKDGSPCLCLAPSKFLQEHVSGEMYAKYKRFLQLRLDASYRSCPNAACLHVQQRGAGPKIDAATKEKSGAGEDTMQCEKCGLVYCFLHDLAHVGSDCASYAKRLAVESASSLEFISSHTVKCPWPTCRVAVTKSSGCNHMTCSRCGSDFCYLCGGYYLGGLHFAPCNVLGCPNMKGRDLPANSRNTLARNVAKVLFGVPLMVTLCLLVLALVVAIEAIYLAWVVGLAPLWVVLGCVLKYKKSRGSGYQGGMWKWQERYNKCLTWGIRIIGWVCG